MADEEALPNPFGNAGDGGGGSGMGGLGGGDVEMNGEEVLVAVHCGRLNCVASSASDDATKETTTPKETKEETKEGTKETTTGGGDGEKKSSDERAGEEEKEAKKSRKVMRADPTKAKLRIVRGIDGLTRVQFGERNPSTPYEPTEDIIVFPQECLAKPMKQPSCFALKFVEDPSRDMFFWFQEKAEVDKEALLKKINESLNQNPMDGRGGGGGGVSDGGGLNVAEADFEQQLRDAIAASQMPPDTPVENTNNDNNNNDTAPKAPKKEDKPFSETVEAERLTSGGTSSQDEKPAEQALAEKSITSEEMARTMATTMSGINIPNFAGASPVAIGGTPQGSLKDVLKPEIVGPILRNKEVRDRLLEHLPEEHRESADLEELIQTPQFKSQLERFSDALKSGQMDLSQFGLKAETNSPIADLRTFLKAIQDQVQEKEKNGTMSKDDAAMEG